MILPLASALVTFVAAPPPLDHDALTRALRDLDSHDSVSLGTVGSSREDRELWLVRVGSAADRPTILIDAGRDGAHPVTTRVAVRALEMLVNERSPEDLVDLTSRVTLHVIPRVNPDGAERRAQSGARWQSLLPIPMDDDGDGRVDEDGPDDVDGDGRIGWMRVADPLGTWVADPGDGRWLAEREADDEGPFYRRYREGVDNDGDGLLNEDGEGGVAVDHNFPQGWEIPSRQEHAGPFPGSEPETLALLEYAVANPQIALALSLSGADRPERPGTEAASVIPGSDGDIFARLGERLESVRGSGLDIDFSSPGAGAIGGAGQFLGSLPANAPAGPITRAVVPGRFVDWMYFQHGAYALAPQMWVDAPPVPVDTTAVADSTAVEARDGHSLDWATWIDSVAPDELRAWRPHSHPTLGPVEIGGLASDHRHEPDAATVDSLATQLVDLVLDLAPRLGRVEIESVDVSVASGSLHRVSATIRNPGELPTLSAAGRDTRLFHPVMVALTVPSSCRIVDGPARVRVGTLEPRSRRTVEWFVSGPAGESVRVDVSSVKAGRARATARLSAGGSR